MCIKKEITAESIKELWDTIGVPEHQQVIRDAQAELHRDLDQRVLSILSRAGVSMFEYKDCSLVTQNTPTGFTYRVKFKCKTIGEIIVTISDFSINIKHNYL